METLASPLIEATENDTQDQSESVSYEGYRDNYEHFRLRLRSTLECALAQNDEGTTRRLLTVETINALAGTTTFYQSNHSDRVHEESRLPFRISSEPFVLPESVRSKLEVYGKAISAYYKVCDELLRELPSDHRWTKYLNHHKPDSLLALSETADANHVFLRPDFILTGEEPTVTEIETSPFGLALSHFLNVSYSQSGQKTLVDPSQLLVELIRSTVGEDVEGKHFCLALTEYTKRYEGQFHYLADALKKMGVDTTVCMVDDLEVDESEIRKDGRKVDTLYRGFYLHQAVEDPKVAALLERSQGKLFPACKPQLEEKALMGMLWDPELEPLLSAKLRENFGILRRIVPPTWVLDQNNMPTNFPFEIKSWEDFAKLGRKQRAFVLKTSGFSSQSSWAKGVTFLEKLSQEKCRAVLLEALADTGDLFVIQQFRKGTDFDHEYFDFHSSAMKKMKGRVRFTPYYSAQSGKLLTAKATLCENTDYVHAMVDSINAPVI